MVLAPLVILAAFILALWCRPWPLFPTQPQTGLPGERNVASEFSQWVERRARARGLDVRGVARRVSLKCPRCGENSNYFVYPDGVCERCWRSSLKPMPPIGGEGMSKSI